MTKTRVIIVICFLVAFAAGIASGMLLARPKPVAEPERSTLATELDLTPAQQEQMKAIWSEARQMSEANDKTQHDRRQTLQKERDDAVQVLLTDEQKQKFAQINQDYAKKVKELDDERRKPFQTAVTRTKEILTEAQSAKYEEILSKRGGFRRDHRSDGAERGRPRSSTTVPGKGAPPKGAPSETSATPLTDAPAQNPASRGDGTAQ